MPVELMCKICGVFITVFIRVEDIDLFNSGTINIDRLEYLTDGEKNLIISKECITCDASSDASGLNDGLDNSR